MAKISVVLPIYRTAQYLRELHQRLVAALEALGDNFELIMVDDLDSTPTAKDIDAERSLLVFAYLNFKKLSNPGAASSSAG